MGGAQRHLVTLLDGLRPRFDCDVVYFKDPDLLDEVRAVAGNVARFDLGGAAAPRRVWGLLGHIRGGGYQLVHTHLLKADMWGMLAARLAGLSRVVSTKHNREVSLRNPLFAVIHGAGSRLATRVIAISSSVAEYMTTTGRVPGEKIAVIHYGLDAGSPPGPEAALRVRMGFGIGMNVPLALCAARLDPQKDHETLLRAWSIVARELPSARLLLAGGPQVGGEAHVRNLKSLAQRLDLTGKVFFAGVRRDVPDLLAACDVLAMSSRWEGLGLVFLEAMRAGRPVVATNVGGVPEVVVPGETGTLVSPGDPAAFAAALIDLLKHPRMALTMGQAGRRRFEQRFAAGAMVAKTSDLYDRMLNG